MTKFAFADASISLGVQHVMATAAVEVDRSVHHHLIIDMSYSMCRNLPQLASDCKDILRNSVRVGDKVSIEYFSGRNQFGYIVKSFQVDNAAHIRELDMQIERGFRPIGCTGFVEPIDEAVKHVTADDVNTLMFMSDGYDNCWNAKQILASTAKAGEVFDSIVIVEYGWNANRTLLTQMAREVGAQYVFSENVTEFSRAIDNFIQSKPVAMRRVEVTTGSTIGDIAYADGIVYDVKDGKVQVPENAGDVVYLVNGKSSDTGLNQSHIGSLYGLMSAYATLMRSDVVYDILGELGDVRFIKAFVNCFGKQSYTEFKAMCDKAASDASQRFTEGQDFNLMPDENAFTVLDVINALTEDGVKLLVGSDNFSYNRIGKATASAHSVDHAQLAELSGKLAKAKTSAELKSIQEAISALTEGSKELEFVPTTTEVSFANMTFNSKRPNISGLVRIEGYVNVGTNDLGLPEQVPTFVWRNYTIIRDGIVNMDTVPVKMPYAVYKELRDNGVAMTPWSEDGEVVVTLKGMPIVNRKMVKNVSAKELFRKEVALVELKAFAKVFKEMQDRIAPVNKSAGMAEIYGQVASDWLAERGITDKGFAPKVVQVEGEDFYIGKEIKVSLKGLSSLPKVADVEALIINNANPANRQKKVNVAARMMIKALDAFNKVAVADRAKWIKAQTEKTIDSKRELELDIAKEKFAVIVGQVWFPEFKSMDDNTLTVDYDGESITCSVELKEVEVKI